jgi:arylsulfatase A-like enzyme
VLSGAGDLADEDRRHLESQYDGGIAYEDAELAAIFERMRALGVLDRTIVFVTADHGESFGEHATMSHGVSVFDEQVHVPAILRVPGTVSGVRDARPVGTGAIADLLPELSTSRVEARAQLVENIDRSDVVSESHPESWLRRLDPRISGPSRALVYGNEKLVAARQAIEVYDLASDPHELSPNREPSRVAFLASRLDHWLERHPDGTGSRTTLDPDLTDALRSLGYVVDSEPAKKDGGSGAADGPAERRR